MVLSMGLAAGLKGWRSLLWLCLALAGLSNAHGLHAKESLRDLTLPEVVVSASHIPTTAERSSASVTVIPRDAIEALNPISMVELLRHVPGLHIDQAGGRGGLSALYLRGADPNYTLVQIDGVKVNDPTDSRGGSFDFSTLDVDNVERVEIIRSPYSAVHGSDALAGVINIVTVKGTDRHEGSVVAGLGKDGYYHAYGGARGPLSEKAGFWA